MPDDNDLSIDEINELFNSVIEGPDEWKIGAAPTFDQQLEKYTHNDCGGGSCIVP